MTLHVCRVCFQFLSPSSSNLVNFSFFLLSQGHVGMEKIQRLSDAEFSGPFVSQGDECGAGFGERNSAGGEGRGDDEQWSDEGKVLGV
jgi:hypothetical protein